MVTRITTVVKSRTCKSQGRQLPDTSAVSSCAQEAAIGRHVDIGDVDIWHVVSLNSNVPLTPGSEQYQWLQDDLAGNLTKCSLAYWHHPRFTSGPSIGGDYRDLWRLLLSDPLVA